MFFSVIVYPRILSRVPCAIYSRTFFQSLHVFIGISDLTWPKLNTCPEPTSHPCYIQASGSIVQSPQCSAKNRSHLWPTPVLLRKLAFRCLFCNNWCKHWISSICGEASLRKTPACDPLAWWRWRVPWALCSLGSSLNPWPLCLSYPSEDCGLCLQSQCPFNPNHHVSAWVIVVRPLPPRSALYTPVGWLLYTVESCYVPLLLKILQGPVLSFLLLLEQTSLLPPRPAAPAPALWLPQSPSDPQVASHPFLSEAGWWPSCPSHAALACPSAFLHTPPLTKGNEIYISLSPTLVIISPKKGVNSVGCVLNTRHNTWCIVRPR